MDSLIKKYNVPTPRYTSYPTVPYWENNQLTDHEWTKQIARGIGKYGNEISLYIHLPFCESLCTFCGCNKRITKNHGVEEPYIEAILEEWSIYLGKMEQPPIISDIHLGGGTPTFFSPKNLSKLIDGIIKPAAVKSNAKFSFEANPVNTDVDQLSTLKKLNFRRVSYGIQDFDPVVQNMINREQSFELIQQVVTESRDLGYSINFDLVYGLPFQKDESIIDTFEKVKILRPDRIAFYSYAHVPWIKGVGQRKFAEDDLPKDDAKRILYELGKDLLSELGYVEIGMDHFSLIDDDLYKAMKEGTLHRNFMGYTDQNNKLTIGLGVSSISDMWGAFAQNEKVLENYLNRVNQGEIPVFRGHILSSEDLVLREYILDIMCKGTVEFNNREDYSDIRDRLQELIKDGLIKQTNGRITLTEKGKPFIRNVCMAFDRRLWRSQPETQLFSMSI